MATSAAAQGRAVRQSILTRFSSGEVRVEVVNAAKARYDVVLHVANEPPIRALIARASPPFQLDSARVLAASRRGVTTYVLLDVVGPSRSPNSSFGFCGAGTERGLVALELTKTKGGGTRVAALTGVVYESCFYSVNQEEPDITISDDRVEGEMIPFPVDADYRRPKDIGRMHYDFAHPEQRFRRGTLGSQ